MGPNPFAEKSVVGGRLCLDFTNTTSRHPPDPEGEWLHGYDDLVWWGLRAVVLQESEAEALFARAAADPAAAAELFARAMELREAVYRLVTAASAGEETSEADLEVLNREAQEASRHLRIVPGRQGFGWRWECTELDRVLWPIARDAAELLVSRELPRVGGCAGESCDWLYLDTSRNHSRRWCTMADCGNRAKAKRHYHRAKAAGAD
ncbi:MAG TPA: ABATE domain-containing protein [Longimicrobiaceae bacterium]|nr:ABATE domain-containing protein [Longimicrobiaceae bacterium]